MLDVFNLMGRMGSRFETETCQQAFWTKLYDEFIPQYFTFLEHLERQTYSESASLESCNA
jgi:hypothetical protein